MQSDVPWGGSSGATIQLEVTYHSLAHCPNLWGSQKRSTVLRCAVPHWNDKSLKVRTGEGVQAIGRLYCHGATVDCVSNSVAATNHPIHQPPSTLLSSAIRGISAIHHNRPRRRVDVIHGWPICTRPHGIASVRSPRRARRASSPHEAQ